MSESLSEEIEDFIEDVENLDGFQTFSKIRDKTVLPKEVLGVRDGNLQHRHYLLAGEPQKLVEHDEGGEELNRQLVLQNGRPVVYLRDDYERIFPDDYRVEAWIKSQDHRAEPVIVKSTGEIGNDLNAVERNLDAPIRVGAYDADRGVIVPTAEENRPLYLEVMPKGQPRVDRRNIGDDEELLIDLSEGDYDRSDIRIRETWRGQGGFDIMLDGDEFYSQDEGSLEPVNSSSDLLEYRVSYEE